MRAPKKKHLTQLLTGLAWVVASGFLKAQTDSLQLPYPITEENQNQANIYLTKPDNITEEVVYDEAHNQYILIYKAGDVEIGREVLTFEEYQEYLERKEREKYWREKEAARRSGKETNSLIPKINLGNETFAGIFGSNKVDIRPQGNVELMLGWVHNRNDNPNLPERQRSVGNFDFRQNIQLNVTGSIGEKIKLNTNFNTQEMFGQNNRANLKYEGQEDDILKVIELGNVTLPLSGTLITGMSTLFGLKTGLQFGKLTVTGVVTQQQGQRQEINVAGGAQVQKFEVSAADYEANRHYFLGEYFKQRYDEALANLPLINSNVRITRVEVWVTNRQNVVENVRNITAVLGLGEKTWPIAGTLGPMDFPDNKNNQFNPAAWNQQDRTSVNSPLFQQLINGQEIEFVNNARLLNPTEYKVNDLLGYISLNQPLNADEVLGVAYQFIGADGKMYQVGEFSTDLPIPNTLMVKLLKSTVLNVKQPNWDWMMKNIYAVGGYQISNNDFVLNILYRDVERGVMINYIPDPAAPPGVKETPLLTVFNLDRLNPNNDQQPDGFFDYIENLTVQSQGGRIIFPVREPFGQYLRQKLGNTVLGNRYAFDSLYTTIQPLAKLNTERNRFYLAGQYKSSVSNEISLNAFNIAKGSVTVTAGGKVLTEGVDYTVDYNLGRIRILNQAILASNTPIKVSLESNQAFNQISKRMAGVHASYKVNKDFVLGATLVNLTERPLTQKINIGDEPISNTMIGFNGSFTRDAPWLTRLVDKLPLISTKAPSKISVTGEFAQLIPGYNKVISKPGISQIDDFEGAETNNDIRNFSFWRLGTVPQRQPDRFPHAAKLNSLEANYNRARLTWYNMDPIFFRQNQLTPEAIYNNPDSRSNLYVCEVPQQALFPNLNVPPGTQPNLLILDIAFQPAIRGPYNFDYKSLAPDGRIAEPRKSFGSMMRRVENTDWDGSNVAYIEFWMMDPFVAEDLNQLRRWETGDPNAINLNTLPGAGGDLLIQIGNMSEDILPDGKMFFENGLPTPTNNLTTSTTKLGKVPAQQLINQYFSNDPNERVYQDVGYDGLPDSEERIFFKSSFLDKLAAQGLTPEAIAAIEADPSADNYKHYNGSAYNNAVLEPGNYIHQRYWYYQLPENNSPAGNINEAQTQNPNTEDVNGDNTLNQSENYFQYRVSIRPEDLVVGKNFITDKAEITLTMPNGKSKKVAWYQFRIPIRSPEREVYGDISDWRSIRFLRFVLTGFPDDIYLRMGRLEIVRADWRPFPEPIYDPTVFSTQSSDPDFFLTTVNIEENNRKKPFNYKLPQGITREIDPSNPALQQLNEQSLVLNVCRLADGQAMAAYKNVNLDLRAYRNLEMFIHVEHDENMPGTLQNGDLSVFIRFGADATENYYEYEVGTIPSVLGNQDVDNIWPPDNKMTVDLQKFPELKRNRNRQQIPLTQLYSELDEKGRRMSVKGNPNLRDIKMLVIGVRNPHKKLNPFNPNDDGDLKCAQIWVNELRVSDYFEKGGWAANARVQANLADLGTVNLAVATERFGFGAIDKRPLERARNNTTSFDFSTNLELAKFTPQKWNLTIPVFFNYGVVNADPQFNPLDPDVRLRDALRDMPDEASREALRQRVKALTERLALNFTNVKKNRSPNAKLHTPLDISNFDFSYSYSTTRQRDFFVEYNNLYSHRGILGYNYSPPQKFFEPFKKAKGLKSPWVKWIKEINFGYLPKTVAFRNDIQRDFTELKFRNNTDYDLLIFPSYKKNFLWNRTYDFAWSIFKSLTVTFNAVNQSRIDEPDGKIDTPAKRDSLRNNIRRFGRTTNYTHNYSVTWNVPVNKLPYLDWITATATYGGSFTWATGQLLRDPQNPNRFYKPWGNTISNSRNINLNGQLNLTTLYNKVPFLKSLNSKTQPQRPPDRKQEQKDKKPGPPDDEQAQNRKPKEVSTVIERVILKKDRPKFIKHNLKTENVKLKVTDENGQEVKGKTEVWDKNRVRFTATRDVKKARVEVTGKIERKSFDPKEILKFFAGLVTAVKNVNLTYTRSEGTALPGYMGNSNILGQDIKARTPGLGFVFGEQLPGNEFARRAGTQGWLTRDSSLNTFFQRSLSHTLNGSATVEPIKNLRIQLSANRQFTTARQSLYRFDPDVNDYRELNAIQTGNFTTTFMTLPTAFIREKNNSSEVFLNMLRNREAISRRLGQQNPHSGSPSALYPNFSKGYNPTQQDVLLYSFLSAYTGTSPEHIALTLFPAIPGINWTATYDGLKNIGILKKLLKNFSISHGYRSTYNINNFLTNQAFQENPLTPGFTDVLDTNQNFQPQYIIQAVSITEAFSPLLSFDMTWFNSITSKFEIKKSRNLTLNFQNGQVTEVASEEYLLGAGYKVPKVKLPFFIAGKQPESDVTLRLDLGVRNNKTTVRKVADKPEDAQQTATAGQQNITIKFFAEYALTKNFSIRFYFDRIQNNPFVANQFRTVNTNSGLSLRFTLTP
ncbi:MAG: cell surface protein SprA [Flavobacteriales bacterium]|nr:cell surface protein SprA [Flavobacteriales bacterium]MDW8409295.1 cell surface protein SprA [Flavobacteriales bacterium]